MSGFICIVMSSRLPNRPQSDLNSNCCYTCLFILNYQTMVAVLEMSGFSL